ncbi:MAG: SAM-dependent methyltransferase [Pyrinomonadaceae bacterium]
MKIKEPRFGTKKIADKIRGSFSHKEGSQHIAMRTAVSGLMRLLKREEPKSILEIGAGIGTLTYTTIQTLARHGIEDYRYMCVENNEYCKQRLEENLQAMMARITMVDGVQFLPSVPESFDFMILDGGDHDDPSLFARLSDGATVFIEGGRAKQAAVLQTVLGDRPFVKAVVRTSQIKNIVDQSVKWEKGYRVYKLNPGHMDRGYFWLLNLKEKIRLRLRRYIYINPLGEVNVDLKNVGRNRN